jgi:hypothetical protein
MEKAGLTAKLVFVVSLGAAWWWWPRGGVRRLVQGGVGGREPWRTASWGRSARSMGFLFFFYFFQKSMPRASHGRHLLCTRVPAHSEGALCRLKYASEGGHRQTFCRRYSALRQGRLTRTLTAYCPFPIVIFARTTTSYGLFKSFEKLEH